MKSEAEVIQQLQALKGMTISTGIIHEAQLLQLQMWPLVVFPFALSTTAEIDTENHTVTFNILTSLKEEPKGKANEKAKGYIIKWVRNILWDNTNVVFRFKHGSIKRTRSSTGRRAKDIN